MVLDYKETKRVLIAGCRNFDNYFLAKNFIDNCISRIRVNNRIIIVSGGANGADKLAEIYAAENNYKFECYLPDWKKYGKSAGPKRNLEMVKKSDYVICFWDVNSRGTKSTVSYAVKYNKPIKIKFINRI